MTSAAASLCYTSVIDRDLLLHLVLQFTFDDVLQHASQDEVFQVSLVAHCLAPTVKHVVSL